MSAHLPASTLHTVEQVRRIDQAAIRDQRIAGIELMQRAADAALAMLRRRWPQARRLRVVAGNGNNGGDAFLLAHGARAAGMQVELLALNGQSRGDAAVARRRWLDGGGRVLAPEEGMQPDSAEVLVDGLFGVGLSRAVEGPAAHLLQRMNDFAGPRFALDVPSGLDADRGVAQGTVLRADATLCFVGWKRGLFTADGVDCCGHLELDTLGIAEHAYADVGGDGELLGAGIVGLLPPRRNNVNKGRYGHVLAIGGDSGMAGAIRLCGEAALRSGAGLVSLATRAEHVLAINAARAELMAVAVDGPQSIEHLMQRASVIAVGPGLGQGAWGHALWDKAIHAGRPLVLDADALNLLARHPSTLSGDTILTPHPGEAARLLECSSADVQADRFAAVRELARRHACVVVLKGTGSLIADSTGRLALCPFGNPGMASGGMGDVLTGIVAGLRAQGLGAWDAARLGVVAHAIAGDRAAGAAPRGLIASDLFAPLRAFLNGAHA
jgi:NAD(P)H-hydrate epimerase